MLRSKTKSKSTLPYYDRLCEISSKYKFHILNNNVLLPPSENTIPIEELTTPIVESTFNKKEKKQLRKTSEKISLYPEQNLRIRGIVRALDLGLFKVPQQITHDGKIIWQNGLISWDFWKLLCSFHDRYKEIDSHWSTMDDNVELNYLLNQTDDDDDHDINHFCELGTSKIVHYQLEDNNYSLLLPANYELIDSDKILPSASRNKLLCTFCNQSSAGNEARFIDTSEFNQSMCLFCALRRTDKLADQFEFWHSELLNAYEKHT